MATKQGLGIASEASSKMAPIKGLKPRPEWQWKVLKLFMLSLCLMLFTWQFSFIFRDYLDGRTTVTTEQKVYDSLALPAITICAPPSLDGFDSDNSSEWSHEKLFPSFHADESDEHIEDYLKETENWKWKKFNSLILGPCYMFEFTQNVSTGTEGPDVSLWINVNPDTTKSLKMFIHEPGAEIWLLHANLLIKGQAAVFTLPKTGFTDLSLEKVVTSGFSRPEQKGSCFDITQKELHECIRKNYRNDMIKMINCTLDDYAWVMEGTDPPVPRCQNQSESYATIKDGDFKVVGDCKTPCLWTDFTPRIVNYDDTHYVDSTLLYIAYLTTMNVEKTEVLMYDIPNMLSNLGGTLGMYLGFSLWASLLDILDYLKAKLSK